MPRTIAPTKSAQPSTVSFKTSRGPATPRRSLPPASPPDQESKRGRGRPTNRELFAAKKQAKESGRSRKDDPTWRKANGIGIDAMFPKTMPNRLAEIQEFLGTPTPKVIAEVPELWLNPPVIECTHLEASSPQISPALIQAICYGVERGMSLAAICRYLGVEYKRIFEWRRDGLARREGLKYYLARGIEIARTRFEMTYLDIIQRAAFGLDHTVSIKTKKVMGEIVEENMEYKTGKINPEQARWLLERRLRTTYAPSTVDPASANTMDNDFDDAEDLDAEDALSGIDSSVLGPDFAPAIDMIPITGEEAEGEND